jgi:hypothetical protein
MWSRRIFWSGASARSGTVEALVPDFGSGASSFGMGCFRSVW